MEVADFLWKEGCFPIFCSVQNAGYLKENTDVFVDDFLSYFFLILCCLYLFCLVLEFCVLSRCWSWQSGKHNSERMRALLLRDTKPFVEHPSFLVTTLKSERVQIQLMNILHRSPKTPEVGVLLHNPIGFMGLVYLPAFTIKLNQM